MVLDQLTRNPKPRSRVAAENKRWIAVGHTGLLKREGADRIDRLRDPNRRVTSHEPSLGPFSRGDRSHAISSALPPAQSRVNSTWWAARSLLHLSGGAGAVGAAGVDRSSAAGRDNQASTSTPNGGKTSLGLITATPRLDYPPPSLLEPVHLRARRGLPTVPACRAPPT